jgi:hypothetical protein
MLGLHRGGMQPRHEVDEYDGPDLSVFVCNRCGAVLGRSGDSEDDR